MTASHVDLSVVIPTFNGSQFLEPLTDRLARTLDARGLSWELVVVNDASPDDTWMVIETLASRDPRVRGVDLLHNHGQPVATMCGLALSRGQLVATMDDDLQHPPEELPKLLDALARHKELDAVVGAWARDQGLVRELGSRVHALSDRVAHQTPKGFRYTAFRVMRRPVVDAMLGNQTRMPLIGPLLTRSTDRVRNVQVRHEPRTSGTSNFRFRHGVSMVLTNFAQGSTLPLRIMSWFGFGVAALSFSLATILLVRYLVGVDTTPGWLSVFLATMFFGGAILVQIGLVSQYIHLIVREVRRPPRWDIRQTTHSSSGVASPPSAVSIEQP